MKIGTFFIDVYGELLFKNSVEIIRSTMDQNLATVTDKFDFDHIISIIILQKGG